MMLGFNLNIDILSIFVMMYVIITLSILSSLINAYVNLYMPKFDFQSEVEVIKQSIASMVGVFGGFAILISFGFIYYYLSDWWNTQGALFSIGTIMAIVAGVLTMYLKPVSEKQFNKM